MLSLAHGSRRARTAVSALASNSKPIYTQFSHRCSQEIRLYRTSLVAPQAHRLQRVFRCSTGDRGGGVCANHKRRRIVTFLHCCILPTLACCRTLRGKAARHRCGRYRIVTSEHLSHQRQSTRKEFNKDTWRWQKCGVLCGTLRLPDLSGFLAASSRNDHA